MTGCTCNGGFWSDGSRVVTVGCRVHHLMPDGCVAADHEVRCEGCGQFLCDHECAWYDEIDPDVPEDERGEFLECSECGEFGVRQGTLKKCGETVL